MKPAPDQFPRPDSECFRFTCATEGDRFTVTVLGKINAANARPIRRRCNDAVYHGAVHLAVDVALVDELKAQFERWKLTPYFEFRESLTVPASQTASEVTR